MLPATTTITTPYLYPYYHVELDDTWAGLHSGWRAVLAELLGTLMYVFISSGVSIACNVFVVVQPSFSITVPVIALANGFAFTTLVFAFYHLSGGHLNPAITWGAVITRRIGIMRGIAYMIAQIVGGILGALLITAATPSEYHGRIGAHFWEESLSNFNGILLMASLTFFLVFVVFATIFDPVGMGKLAPLPIGFTITFGYLVGWVFVGPPMNPARALGTAIVYGTYDHIWVYFAGPFIGATIAALLYTVLFMSRPIPRHDIKNDIITETTRLIPGGIASV